MNGRQVMRRSRQVLRDLSRNVYYQGSGQWTADIEQAKHFPDMRELIAVCEHCGIRDAEVVEHFPGGHLDFHAPVDNQPGRTP